MCQILTLLDKIISLLPEVNHEGGSGENLKFPEFDLMPHDYLNFAEKSIKDKSNFSKINCVSNLKRALECEMDTFLHVMGLFELVKEKNLGFDKKLDFIGKIEIYESRSFNKLNTLRNKVGSSLFWVGRVGLG